MLKPVDDSQVKPRAALDWRAPAFHKVEVGSGGEVDLATFCVEGNDSAVVSVSYAKLPSTVEQVSYVAGALALPYWIDALLPDSASGLHFTGILGSGRTMHFAFPQALPTYNSDPDDANGFTGAAPTAPTAVQDVGWREVKAPAPDTAGRTPSHP